MTKVISYFSYKGGAGRSTLAFNTIPILAAEHLHPTKFAPIIIVDMDIDSCGMSYLLEVENDITDENCVQHLLNSGCSNEFKPNIFEHPTFANLCPVGNKFGYYDNEAILFMPAKDIKNVDTSGNSNYGDANNPFRPRLQGFIDICNEYNVPAVIFDSAVGNNATANAANQIADIMVCCMRPTTQFVNGTIRYLEALDSDDSSPLGGGCKKIVLVPNVVPQDRMVIDNQRYPDVAINRIIDKLRPILDGRDDFDDITYEIGMLNEDEFGIPAINSFMWREGLLYTQDSHNENEMLALARYKKLAGIISDLCK